MLAFHNTVGTLVIVGYLVVTVLYLLVSRGRDMRWARGVSFGAAALLLLQYILGISLWGMEAYDPRTSHYTLALLALLTVGLEHGYAPTRATPRERARYGALASGLTFLLVVAAYVVGTSN